MHDVLATPLASHLRPRLTRCAQEEMHIFQDCVRQVTLTDSSVTRLLATHPPKPFTSRNILDALQQGHIQDPDAARVWRTKLPTKIKFFSWLLHHGRLNTRASLFHRNIKTLEESYCERCSGVLETDTHIFILCPAAKEFWAKIGIEPGPEELRLPWILGKELQLPDSVHLDVILLSLWQIWKARNALIFYQKHLAAAVVLRQVVDSMESWRCRYRNKQLQWDCWLSFFLSKL